MNMAIPLKKVNHVSLLTAGQIAQFKRDGFLVLPAVLDSGLCRQVRDAMWDTIAANLPRMKRGDATTWKPFSEEETARLSANLPASGGEPYFSGRGHRFFVRNGAEQTMLDLAPRALWQVAEQLLGKQTVVWPAGLDASGITTGPCFMCDDTVSGLASHLVAKDTDEPAKGSFITQQKMQLPKTGPIWLNGQGTRGLYCTLPQSPAPSSDYSGAHSDGACYGRWRLQMSAYIDDIPPHSGGFTVWPGSHTRIWQEQWKAFQEGEKHTDKHLSVRKAGGYTDPVIGQIKKDTQPVECYGPAGTVVLWHTKILHIAGQNTSTNVIRQATIYGFQKTLEALSDALVVDNTNGDIWRDWSDVMQN